MNANFVKVLIVHSDDDGSKKLREQLEKKGIEVLITPELFSGLTQYTEKNPDPILLDLPQAEKSNAQPAPELPDAPFPLDWELHFNVPAQSLGQFDPLPTLMNVLMEYPGINTYRGPISTILAELYCNALEHGVLALNSELKNSHKGFAEYYQIKTEKLTQLQDGFISLTITLRAEREGGCLIFEIEDSGRGFDFKKYTDEFKGNFNYAGRGLSLLFELCESLEFFGLGNHVKAVYRWR